MEKKIKTIFLFGIILGAVFSCNHKDNEPQITVFSMSKAMYEKCAFTAAEMESVESEIRLFGKIEADNNKVAEVHPIVSGVVKSIHVGLGDYVTQGQILASMQSVEVASFQKEKLDAMSAVNFAEKNVKVAQELFAGKLSTERDLITAQTELATAKAELNRILEIHKIYKLKNSSEFNIVAPISGFIVSKKIIVNELLSSTDSDQIFSIADTKNIWAVAYVNESDISKVMEGQKLVVNTLAFPDKLYKSQIEKIYNVIDPTTKAIKIRAVLSNDDFKLKPDMNCTVTLQVPENKKRITIPSSSVIFDKNKYWVMVYKDRKNIETRRIEIHSQLGEKTYVESGLQPGEKVISQNGLLIYDAIND